MESVRNLNNEPNWSEEITLFGEYDGSGASFCRSRNLSVVRFQYWKQKLGKLSGKNVGKLSPFISVKVAAKVERSALPDARWLADLILSLGDGRR